MNKWIPEDLGPVNAPDPGPMDLSRLSSSGV